MSDEPQESANPPPLLKLGKVGKLRDVRRALLKVSNAVLAGRITVGVGNHCIYSLSTIGKVMETELLEQRLQALEDRLGERPDAPKRRGLLMNGSQHG